MHGSSALDLGIVVVSLGIESHDEAHLRLRLSGRARRDGGTRDTKSSSSRAAASAPNISARRLHGDRRRRHAAGIACAICRRAETVLFAVGFDRSGAANRSTTSMPAACETCWPPCPPMSGASSTSARPASTAPAAANGSMKRRRPIRSATAAGHRSRRKQVLAAHPLGERSVILRLAGIYGPGAFRFSTSFARRTDSSTERRLPESDSCRRCGRTSSSQPIATAEPFDNGPRSLLRQRRPSRRARRVLQRSGATDRCARRRSSSNPIRTRRGRRVPERNRRVRNDADAGRTCA